MSNKTPVQQDKKQETLQEDKKQHDKKGDNEKLNTLKQEDLPDATNTSTGKPGSGQRQDSN